MIDLTFLDTYYFTLQVVCAPPTVKIISINRVTVTALRKCLTAVAERERLVNAEDAIESALESSRGDVRNALLTLQVSLHMSPPDALHHPPYYYCSSALYNDEI